jgi:hypothetical protein
MDFTLGISSFSSSTGDADFREEPVRAEPDAEGESPRHGAKAQGADRNDGVHQAGSAEASLQRLAAGGQQAALRLHDQGLQHHRYDLTLLQL